MTTLCVVSFAIYLSHTFYSHTGHEASTDKVKDHSSVSIDTRPPEPAAADTATKGGKQSTLDSPTCVSEKIVPVVYDSDGIIVTW